MARLGEGGDAALGLPFPAGFASWCQWSNTPWGSIVPKWRWWWPRGPIVPLGGTRHPRSVPIPGAMLSSSTHLNYKSRKWKQWSCIQPVLPQGLASVVDGTKCFLEKKKQRERNIVLKGFLFCQVCWWSFAFGLVLLSYLESGSNCSCWTCQEIWCMPVLVLCPNGDFCLLFLSLSFSNGPWTCTC